MEKRTPEPVTIEKAKDLMAQDEMTAAQELVRFTDEYTRRTKSGISNAYTTRLKQYIDAFEELCKEEELPKPENT